MKMLSQAGINQEQVYLIDKDVDLLIECIKRKDTENIAGFYRKYDIDQNSPLRFIVDKFVNDNRLVLVVEDEYGNKTFYGDAALEIIRLLPVQEKKKIDNEDYTETNQDST